MPIIAPVGYTYASLEQDLRKHLVTEADDPEWLAVLPTILQRAELRILREFDLLATRVYSYRTFEGSLIAAQNAILDVPPDCVVIRSLAYFTPVGSDQETGKREQMDRRDEHFIQDYHPSRSVTGKPKYYTEKGHNQILVAPTPDATYQVEMAYTYRPLPLSATNTSTWISQWMPDVLFAACMVLGAGWQKNFGQQSDDPNLAMSWERQYAIASAAALREEGRRKTEGYADKSVTEPPSRVAID